jgi:hypothetical protein
MPLNLTIKDGLIIVVSFILIICISRIRKLKKALILEIQKRLIPNLTLEIDENELGIYIKNESFFLAQNTKIEDTELILDDYGFKFGVILKFEDVGALRSKERLKLKFKAFDKQQNFLADLTERIIPHLISASFKVKIYLSNIENMKFCIALNRRQKKFNVETINFLS